MLQFTSSGLWRANCTRTLSFIIIISIDHHLIWCSLNITCNGDWSHVWWARVYLVSLLCYRPSWVAALAFLRLLFLLSHWAINGLLTLFWSLPFVRWASYILNIVLSSHVMLARLLIWSISLNLLLTWLGYQIVLTSLLGVVDGVKPFIISGSLRWCSHTGISLGMLELFFSLIRSELAVSICTCVIRTDSLTLSSVIHRLPERHLHPPFRLVHLQLSLYELLGSPWYRGKWLRLLCEWISLSDFALLFLMLFHSFW